MIRLPRILPLTRALSQPNLIIGPYLAPSVQRRLAGQLGQPPAPGTPLPIGNPPVPTHTRCIAEQRLSRAAAGTTCDPSAPQKAASCKVHAPRLNSCPVCAAFYATGSADGVNGELVPFSQLPGGRFRAGASFTCNARRPRRRGSLCASPPPKLALPWG